MSPSNQEILAQLEKLAEGKLSGEMVSCYSHSRSAVSYYADLADFPALRAHIATQAEALKVAVEALEKYSDPHKYEDRGMGILVAPDDATAALSRIAALTGEKK